MKTVQPTGMQEWATSVVKGFDKWPSEEELLQMSQEGKNKALERVKVAHHSSPEGVQPPAVHIHKQDEGASFFGNLCG